MLASTTITISPQGNALILLASSGTVTWGRGNTGRLSAVGRSSTNTIKIVAPSGELFSYTATAGESR